MAEIRHFRIPASHHEAARKLWDDMLALSLESQTLNAQYIAEIAALQSKYAPRAEEIAERMTARKLEGTKLMCTAVGVTYDPANSHAFETSYLNSCGAAFFTIRFNDPAPVNEAVASLANMEVPAGTKLN